MKNFLLTSAALLAAGWAAHAGDEVFSRPGVTADRAKREVRIEAQATGIAAEEPCEFMLIGPRSGHAYESLAVSRAQPSDIHAALAYIGLAPGKCVSSSALQFWPRGPMVTARVALPKEDSQQTEEVSIESFMYDREARQPLAASGFMFTGSRKMTDPDLATNEFYAADLLDPGSILPTFNETSSVLDIPRQGSQSQLYGRHTVNPARRMEKDAPLTVILRPAAPADALLVPTDTALNLAWTNDALELRWAAAEGWNGATGTVTSVEAHLGDALRAPKAVYASVQFDRATPLRALAEPCNAIETWVIEKGLRISAPDARNLFYRAFIPKPEFKERGDRPSHPLEIRLKSADGGWRAAVTLVTAERDPMTDQRTFSEESWTAATPAELAALARAHGAMLPVVIVFAPESMRYGDLADWIAPLRASHPVAHVYTEPAAKE